MRQILLKKINTYAFDKATKGLLFDQEPEDFDPKTQEWEVLDYAVQIRSILRRPLNPQAGIGIEEQERSLRLLGALKGKQDGDVLLIEDEADYLHLKEKVEKFPWAYVSEFFLAFTNDIRQAKAISADRLKEEAREEARTELKIGHSDHNGHSAKKSKGFKLVEAGT